MLDKLNPMDIVSAHFRTFKDEKTENTSIPQILFQFAIAILLSCVHIKIYAINETVVGIVISVAAIIAGLLLNVMVLIYTLLTGRLNSTSSNIAMIKSIGKETISNIAFSVLCSLLLVIASLLNLAEDSYTKNIGQFFMIFFGVFLIITILIILINFYTILEKGIK
jgi:hypothetical protein